MQKQYPPRSPTTPQEGNFHTNNSPLEGCLQGGVDIISLKSIESPDWTKNSLFPYWSLPKNQKLRDRAKELRKQWILSEVIFWQSFKDKQKLWWDIDRQVIIGHYIVDFLIPELGIVFEIDGSSHDEKQEYDAERNAFLEGLWLNVIHILDADVKRNMDEIYEYVHLCIYERERFLKTQLWSI